MGEALGWILVIGFLGYLAYQVLMMAYEGFRDRNTDDAVIGSSWIVWIVFIVISVFVLL